MIELIGKANPITAAGLARAASWIEVDQSLLWAITDVETNGCGFRPTKEVVLRFELSTFKSYSPDVGRVLARTMKENTYRQQQAFALAVAMDERAALLATSYGIGQIMGFNADTIGWHSPAEMVQAFVDEEDMQLFAIATFCKNRNIHRHLRNGSLDKFAFFYNGPKYRRNRYAERLAAAAEARRLHPPVLSVRSEQMQLMFEGYYRGKVDGLLGPQTIAARAAKANSDVFS